MLHLVDTVELEPERVDRYLELVGTLGMAVMTDAGAAFVSCATTPGGLGEPLQVQVVWSCNDFVHWNEIRKNMVLDPRYHEYGSMAASLRIGGIRRFFVPVTLSPSA
jgi:hypothetical protein